MYYSQPKNILKERLYLGYTLKESLLLSLLIIINIIFIAILSLKAILGLIPIAIFSFLISKRSSDKSILSQIIVRIKFSRSTKIFIKKGENENWKYKKNI